MPWVRGPRRNGRRTGQATFPVIRIGRWVGHGRKSSLSPLPSFAVLHDAFDVLPRRRLALLPRNRFRLVQPPFRLGHIPPSLSGPAWAGPREGGRVTAAQAVRPLAKRAARDRYSTAPARARKATKAAIHLTSRICTDSSFFA